MNNISVDVAAHYPKLSEIELAVAIEACSDAGARNAAIALSKHITRLQIELDIKKLRIDEIIAWKCNCGYINLNPENPQCEMCRGIRGNFR